MNLKLDSQFFPIYTQRVIERINMIETFGNGNTRRSMKETVIYQLNENLILQLLAENKMLKQKIEDLRIAERKKSVHELFDFFL